MLYTIFLKQQKFWYSIQYKYSMFRDIFLQILGKFPMSVNYCFFAIRWAIQQANIVVYSYHYLLDPKVLVSC